MNSEITWLDLVRKDDVFAKFRWCFCKGGWCSYSGYQKICQYEIFVPPKKLQENATRSHRYSQQGVRDEPFAIAKSTTFIAIRTLKWVKKAGEPMEPKLSAQKKKTHTLPRGFCGKYEILSGSKRESFWSDVVVYQQRRLVRCKGRGFFLEITIRNVLWNAKNSAGNVLRFGWTFSFSCFLVRQGAYAHHSFFHPSPTTIIFYSPPTSQPLHLKPFTVQRSITESVLLTPTQTYASSKYFQKSGLFFNILYDKPNGTVCICGGKVGKLILLTRGSPFPMETALHYVFLIRYGWLRNLCRLLEFAESPTKFSGESPKSAK